MDNSSLGTQTAYPPGTVHSRFFATFLRLTEIAHDADYMARRGLVNIDLARKRHPTEKMGYLGDWGCAFIVASCLLTR